MKFRSIYSEHFEKPGIIFEEPSMCQQQFKAECDINTILKHYRVTGVLPEVQDTPIYGDFSSVADFMSAQEVYLNAQEQFNNLSSDVRKRFNNDPSEFLAFVSDEANIEESYKLGIRIRPEAAETPSSVIQED